MLAFLLACTGAKTDTGTEVPTFTELEQEVFGVSCAFSSCHGAGAGGLDLDGETDYGRLVGVSSTVVEDAVLVVPGDPGASYLLSKMEGSDGIAGDIMPPGTGMDPGTVEGVRAWIAAGAPDN